MLTDNLADFLKIYPEIVDFERPLENFSFEPPVPSREDVTFEFD